MARVIPAKVSSSHTIGGVWLRVGGPALGLAVLALLAYARVWHAGFIWDDDAHLTRHACIVGPLGFKEIWTTVEANYFPMVLTHFWVLHKIFGLQPLPYHVITVLLHIANGWLLWAVLRKLGVRGAWLGAALWTLHPVQAESVAWVSEFTNTQSGLFFLAAILAFLGWLDTTETDQRRRGILYGLVCVFSACAMLSKPSTAVLPAVLVLCWWWRKKPWTWRMIPVLAPLFAMSAAWSGWTIWEQKFHSGANGSEWHASLFERLVISGRDMWFYLGKLAWPQPLIFVYPRWEIRTEAVGIFLLIAAVLATVLLFWMRNSRIRPVVFGLAFFGLGVLPVLGFFNVYYFRFSFVADHFQYLASMGPLALAGAGIATLAVNTRRTAVFAGAGLLVATCVGLTWVRTLDFYNWVSLWTSTVQKNPVCWMAHNNFGVELIDTGAAGSDVAPIMHAGGKSPATREELNQLTHDPVIAANLAERPEYVRIGLAHYATALGLNPDYAEAHYNLANELAKVPSGSTAAIEHYETALRINPNFAEAHENLANVLQNVSGRLPEALGHFRAALKTKPQMAAMHFNLANALVKIPDGVPEAITEYEAALRLAPQLAVAHMNLAIQLANFPNRMGEAIAHYQEAIRITPKDPAPHNNLGVAYYRAGDKAQAIAELEAALRLNPGYEEARRNLEFVKSAP
jgi:protein O-mannosyl-transferase